MEPKTLRRIRTGLIVTTTVLLALLLTRTAVEAFRPHLYAGTVLSGDAPAAAMDGLYLANGDEVDLLAFNDELLLVYFGYTNCPDVCPNTLANATKALGQLSAEQRDRATLLMISVDPARDDVESLQRYVEFFDPSFLGATGTVADIDRVASLYGVFYELGEGSATEGYVVDHTATLMGIGPDGALRIVWSPDLTADDLAGDINELLG